MAKRQRKPKVIGPGQKAARGILIGFMHGLFALTRSVRFQNAPEIENPCVIAVFHDELLPLCNYFSHSNANTIASQNHFGYAIGKALERYGYTVALGSPSRGGRDAFFQLLRGAKSASATVFTVDGSRGPRHEMKPGAVALARKTKLPLYLMRVEYRGWRIASTWDKFKVPYPFAKVRFYWEQFPLEDYASEEDVEKITEDAGQRLRDLLADDYRAAS
ncbi:MULTISPECIES: DUF374 domain-containing protein [Spongiibacter]|uniref:lysophospholipid acyltransferase family protein n=1 Tax=Spongiibacter TaxID=630749 RepID=UPI001B117380|nr:MULTISPECIES: DUF374 domain-containing protein [Spongiibacter]MBO6753465.1 DUF374 domain-containing protein [Spongiibacter sp.]